MHVIFYEYFGKMLKRDLNAWIRLLNCNYNSLFLRIIQLFVIVFSVLLVPYSWILPLHIFHWNRFVFCVHVNDIINVIKYLFWIWFSSVSCKFYERLNLDMNPKKMNKYQNKTKNLMKFGENSCFSYGQKNVLFCSSNSKIIKQEEKGRIGLQQCLIKLFSNGDKWLSNHSQYGWANEKMRHS